MSGNTDSWWDDGNDIWKSRWAPPKPRVSSKAKVIIAPEQKNPSTAATLATETSQSLNKFSLTNGLDASCWATSSSVPPRLRERGSGHAARRGDRGGGGGGGNINGQSLSVHTGPPAKGAKFQYDDTRDVVMGENTPTTSPIDVQFPSTTLKTDADGDIIMDDLDDVAAASQINQALSDQRVGPLQSQKEIKDSSLDPGMRASVVKWVLVVDTSFILSHLHLVDNLVDAYHRWGNVVMLPWATIMELDGLKKSNSNIRVKNAKGIEETVSLGMLARRANHWCYETMAKRKSGLWGQMKEEVIDPMAVKGDAAILDCCRFVKQKKSVHTAILSNDKNLCYRALVYNVSAVSFAGTPLTADGVMKTLESNKKDTSSSRPPGIWSSVEDFDKPVPKLPENPPSFPKTPPRVEITGKGLYDSLYTGSSCGAVAPSDGNRSGHGHGNFNNLPKVQADVGLLLLRIEDDLLTNIVPLLHALWTSSNLISRGIQDPSGARNLENIEISLWHCVQPLFDQLYPGKTEIRGQVSSSELSRIWNAWGSWSAPDLQRLPSVKPTPQGLTRFIESWEVLWRGLIHFAQEPEDTNRRLLLTVETWKALISGLAHSLAAFK